MQDLATDSETSLQTGHLLVEAKQGSQLPDSLVVKLVFFCNYHLTETALSFHWHFWLLIAALCHLEEFLGSWHVFAAGATLVGCLQALSNAQQAADGEVPQAQRDRRILLAEVHSNGVLTARQKLGHVEAHSSVHDVHKALQALFLRSIIKPECLMWSRKEWARLATASH